MVRLCSKSSRPYSARPAVQARRQRWARRPAMALVGRQESAEGIVVRLAPHEGLKGVPDQTPVSSSWYLVENRKGLALAMGPVARMTSPKGPSKKVREFLRNRRFPTSCEEPLHERTFRKRP